MSKSNKYLICLNCGNERRFKRNAYSTTTYAETLFLDRQGDIVDCSDFETGDTEQGSVDPIQCDKCYSYNVKKISFNTLVKLKSEHTDIDGKWHQEVLIPEYRKLKNMILAEHVSEIV